MFKKIKHLSCNWIILLLALFFTVVAVELLNRAFSIKSFSKNEHKKFFFEYDSVLGWKHKPNLKGRVVSREYSGFQHLNSKGIRGPEYSYNKNNGEYRILALGDSFAEGYAVEFNEIFSEVLKRELNGKSKRFKYYQVINSGTRGWSTDQELLFFQREGKKYNPDLIVLMFYENDVWGNSQPKRWGRYKPLFTLEKGDLLLTNIPVPKPKIAISDVNKTKNKKSLFKEIKRWLGQKSSLYKFIARRIKNNYYLYTVAIKLGLAENPEPRETATKNAKKDRITLIPMEYGVLKKTYTPEIYDAWRITEAIIIKLKEECGSAGDKLLIFYIPSNAGIYAKEWQDTKKMLGISDEYWDVNQPGFEMQSICKRNNIDFINPSEAFKVKADKLKREGKRLYFKNDGHWNAEGHKLAGEILAEHIVSKYLENNR